MEANNLIIIAEINITNGITFEFQQLGMSVGKLIQKGRQDKGMTQKELATKINEKPQIINEYEQGKGIPNNQIMTKIEKAIGIKLRGKDKGNFIKY